MNVCTSLTNEDLWFAIKGRDFSRVKICINSSISVDWVSPEGYTPLQWSAMKNDTDMAVLLLKNGADVNAQNKFGTTPLCYAVHNQNTDAVKLLLENKADVNKSNKDGEAPFLLATRYGNMSMADLLIKSGADVNKKDEDGTTALKLAVSEGYEEMVSFLLEKDADPNIQDLEGRTTLMSSIESPLTELYASYDKSNEYLCLIHHRKSIMMSLICASADVNIEDNFNNTALYYTVVDQRIRNSERIWQAYTLASHGADIERTYNVLEVSRDIFSIITLFHKGQQDYAKKLSNIIREGNKKYVKTNGY